MSQEIRIVGLVHFPGYMVGEDGSVWSYWKNCGRAPRQIGDTPRQRKPFIFYSNSDYDQKRPYLQVGLFKSGKRYCFYIHTLVLTAFKGPPPPGMECRHDDNDGTNNRLSNLSWSTHLENMHDQKRHGTNPVGIRHWSAKLTEGDIIHIRLLLANKYTIIMIARYFGVNPGTIRDIDQGKTWKHVP